MPIQSGVAASLCHRTPKTRLHRSQSHERVWSITVMNSLKLFVVLLFTCVIASAVCGQKVFRVSDPDAIGPAEVSIAINPRNPDNIVATSFAYGQPPRARYGSYYYSSMDGGKTWRTIPVADPKNLTQGDDVVE